MTDRGPDDNDDDDLDSGRLLGSEDTLVDRGVDDPLDEGYSPPERPWVLDDVGNTVREASGGEGFARRLAREEPETQAGDGDGLGDTTDTDGELFDDEVGTVRAGRLVAAGGQFDDDDELWAQDVGIDGAAASAEEAAVHIIPDREDEDRR